MRLIKRVGLALAALVIAVFLAVEATLAFGPAHLLFHLEQTSQPIRRKSDNLTANLPIRRTALGLLARDIQFRAVGEDWRAFSRSSPRIGRWDILLEIPADQLRAGRNEVELEFLKRLGGPRRIVLSFGYDPAEVALPLLADWTQNDAEVQDGYWERVNTANGWRLRPVPGREGYDRIALVGGAFDGDRRITVDVTFLKNTGAQFGFGVIPLWGGHNDPDRLSPRRGWEYAIAWYYSVPGGFGVEFSRKAGPLASETSGEYHPANIRPGDTYSLVVELKETRGEGRNDVGYEMRMMWTNQTDGQSSDWIELSDDTVDLVVKPYAVALVAHRVQVEFGKVKIEALN